MAPLNQSQEATSVAPVIHMPTMSPCCMNTLGRQPPRRLVCIQFVWGKNPYTYLWSWGLIRISSRHSGT